MKWNPRLYVELIVGKEEIMISKCRTFSPSLFGSQSGFCSEAGTAGASFQIFLHEFPGSDILSESFPRGGHDLDSDAPFSSFSSFSQSRGECHRIKSSKTASGFAALKADISAVTWMRKRHDIFIRTHIYIYAFILSNRELRGKIRINDMQRLANKGSMRTTIESFGG